MNTLCQIKTYQPWRFTYLVPLPSEEAGAYRGAWLIRNTPLLGPYSKLYLESYGGPREGRVVAYERGTPVHDFDDFHRENERARSEYRTCPCNSTPHRSIAVK